MPPGNSAQTILQDPAVLSVLVSTMPSLLVVLDEEGRIMAANPACSHRTGYSQAELEGRVIWDLLIVPEESGDIQEVFRQSRDGDATTRHENFWVLKNGNRIRVSWTNTAVRIAGRRLVVANGIDVSSDWESRAALAEAEARTHSIVNALPDVTLLMSDTGVCLDLHKPDLNSFPLASDAVGSPVESMLPPHQAALCRKYVQEALDSGRTQVFDCDLETATGQVANFEARVTPAAPGKALILVRDISQARRSERALRESRETVLALFETAAQAILVSAQDGRIEMANAEASRLFGYSNEELLKLRIEDLMPRRLGKEHKQLRSRYFAQPRSRPMGIGRDLAARRKDGSEFPVEISLSCFESRTGPRAVAFVSNISARKEAEEALRSREAELERSQTQLRGVMANLVRIQEEERRRVSRELHDDLNQQLAVLGIELGRREQEPPPGPVEFRKWIEGLQDQVATLSDDVRRMAYQLHPATLEYLGLATALEMDCRGFMRREGIPVRFFQKDLPQDIPDEVALCLYRVAQEALQNIAKHARTDHVKLTLLGGAGGVRLSIEDYGVGFDPAHARTRQTLGLLSMEERVRIVNGTLEVSSRPGSGTRIEVFVTIEGAK